MRTKMTFTQSRIFGCALVFTSAVLIATQGTFFEMINNMYSMEKVFFRGVAILLTTSVILVYRRDAVFPHWEDLKWLLVLCLTGFVTPPSRFYSLAMMPFADSFALSLSGVMVLTLIFGRICLKETCGVLETITATAILVGICLVSDPAKICADFSTTSNQTNTTKLSGWDSLSVDNRFLGVAFAIVECISATVMGLATRRVRHIHFGVILLYVAAGAVASSLPLTLLLGKFTSPLQLEEWLCLIGFLVTSVLYYVTCWSAYPLVEAGTLSIIETMEIPVSYILQILVLRVQPTAIVVLGATIICVTNIIFGICTCFRAQDKNSDDSDENQLLNGK